MHISANIMRKELNQETLVVGAVVYGDGNDCALSTLQRSIPTTQCDKSTEGNSHYNSSQTDMVWICQGGDGYPTSEAFHNMYVYMYCTSVCTFICTCIDGWVNKYIHIADIHTTDLSSTLQIDTLTGDNPEFSRLIL